MSSIVVPSKSRDPRLPYEGAPWVAGYDGVSGADRESALAALDELERLISIGTTPALLVSDGDRRVGIGRAGWSRWLELAAPFVSGGAAYARISHRTNLFAWNVGDVSWNLRFDIDALGRRPSIMTAVDEMNRRLRFARTILETVSSPENEGRLLDVMARRSGIMGAAVAQSFEDEQSIWHQDDRVLGDMGGLSSAPEGSLRLSATGRRALDALPTVLHVEHRRGMNPLKSRKVETLTLYAPVSLCRTPGDAMERLRALTVIPEGETWWTR